MVWSAGFCVWMAHGITVMALIVIYAHQCLKRPEYQDSVLEELE